MPKVVFGGDESPRPSLRAASPTAKISHQQETRFASEGKEVETFYLPSMERPMTSFSQEDRLRSSDQGQDSGRQGRVSYASSVDLDGLDEAWNDRAAELMKDRVRQALNKPTYNVQDFYKTHGLIPQIARSTVFENITLGIISINAIWMAVDTDWNLAETLVTSEWQYQVMEHTFCLFFSFEWFVRFMSFKDKVNCMKDAWFVFDSLLVALMIMETWVMSSILLLMETRSGKSPLSNASILRLFRLLRLSRLVRMLRSLPELMILVKGLLAAVKSVFSVMCLLLLFMYVFAIALTQLTTGTRVGDQFFPSVSESMFTLLVYSTFLDSPTDMWDALAPESPLGLIVYFCFTMLAAFTILNMLIGVLCEVVSAVAAIEREAASASFVTEQLHKIVVTLDEDGDECIDRGEFLKILGEPFAVRALENVGVDPVGMVDVADYIFDASDACDSLSFKEFMDVVLGLRGTNFATKKDIIDLQKFVVHAMDSLQANVTNCLYDGEYRKARINFRRSSSQRKSSNADKDNSVGPRKSFLRVNGGSSRDSPDYEAYLPGQTDGSPPLPRRKASQGAGPLPEWLTQELLALEQRTASMEELVVGLAEEVRLLAAAVCQAGPPPLPAWAEDLGAHDGSLAGVPAGDLVMTFLLENLPPPPQPPHTPCSSPPPSRGASSSVGASGRAAKGSAAAPVETPPVALSATSDLRCADAVRAGVLRVAPPRTPCDEPKTGLSESDGEGGFAKWPLGLRKGGSRRNVHPGRNSEPTLPVGSAATWGGPPAVPSERRCPLPPPSQRHLSSREWAQSLRPNSLRPNSADGVEGVWAYCHYPEYPMEEPSDRTDEYIAAVKAELQLAELPSLHRMQDPPVAQEHACSDDELSEETLGTHRGGPGDGEPP